MKHAALLVFAILLLGHCTVLPTRTESWIEFVTLVDQMPAGELAQARDLTRAQYQAQADDEIRLRLGYLLSRGQPSLQQLHEARGILREIDSDGPQAALRDLQDREVGLQIQLHDARGQLLELRAQLEALKKIEADLAGEQGDSR